MNDRLQYFLARVKKPVYRNQIAGLGEDTQHIKGVTIMSERHAIGLYDIEQTSNGLIRYFDSQEEAKEFKLNN